jgi:hypothetical protein
VTDNPIAPRVAFRKLNHFGITTSWTPDIVLNGCAGQPMIPTLNASNAQLTIRTQPPFIGTPPDGLVPGWPALDGSRGSPLDTSTAGGSATSTSGYVMDTAASPGFMQVTDAYIFGAFYFEIEVTATNIFSGLLGGGVARRFPGLDYNQWVFDGRYSATDTNGGAIGLTNSWPTFTLDIGAEGSDLYPAFATLTQGDVLCVQFRAFPQYPFYPANLVPVSLPCVPCCPLVGKPGRWV